MGGVGMTIREFALELLQSAGCSLDCYKGDSAKYALQDVLSVSKERELPFPVEDIANELIKIGNEQPDPPAKGHKPFKVIYETDDFVDGIEEDNFEDAKANALSILMDWIVEEQVQWELDSDSVPRPTEKQIEAWDTMIESCSVRYFQLFACIILIC